VTAGTLMFGEGTAGPHAVTSTAAGDTYTYNGDGAVEWRRLAQIFHRAA